MSIRTALSRLLASTAPRDAEAHFGTAETAAAARAIRDEPKPRLVRSPRG